MFVKLYNFFMLFANPLPFLWTNIYKESIFLALYGIIACYFYSNGNSIIHTQNAGGYWSHVVVKANHFSGKCFKKYLVLFYSIFIEYFHISGV